MPFRPRVGDIVELDETGGSALEFLEHPMAPGMPYGSQGSRGIVFQVRELPYGRLSALKVFKPAYQSESTVRSQALMSRYRQLPGLTVWQRQVFTERTNPHLLRRFPDLRYAVLMPWITGMTWSSIILSQHNLPEQQCEALARHFIDLMRVLELNRLAHCDITGGNLIIVSGQNAKVELVDVEDMYAPELTKPEHPPGGSEGYNHQLSAKGIWEPAADRFASAVLAVEMLVWWEEGLRRVSSREHLFEASEMQARGSKYEQVNRTLRDRYGREIAELFEAAWFSDRLEACPSLTDWAEAFQRRGLGAEAALEPMVLPPPAAPKVHPVTGDSVSLNSAAGGQSAPWKRDGESLAGEHPATESRESRKAGVLLPADGIYALLVLMTLIGLVMAYFLIARLVTR